MKVSIGYTIVFYFNDDCAHTRGGIMSLISDRLRFQRRINEFKIMYAKINKTIKK